jgi:protein-L-isoaspartate O-methyltransferase
LLDGNFILVADGFQGLKDYAPFDAIYVGAACPGVFSTLLIILLILLIIYLFK